MNARLDLSRLKKLLLMLSSSSEGEVVNAARLIDSTLRDAGSDWHDLAGTLTSRPRPNHQPPPRDDGPLDWRQQRDFCLEHRRLLRGRELDFLTDLIHWRGLLTDKQASWLAAIYQRLRRTTEENCQCR
jgi:hypothetical protein